MPPTLGMAIDSLAYDKGGADLSATEAGLPPRIRQLRKLYGHLVETDVSDKIYMLLGSFTHKILEATAKELTKDNQRLVIEAISSTLFDYNEGLIDADQLPNLLEKRTWEAVKRTALEDHEVMIENRLFAELDGWTISGQPDLFSIREKHLDDYKVCSVWNHIFGTKSEWEEQQNVYKWLLWRNGKEVATSTIQAIFRDYQKSKARWDPTYPPDQWMTYEINLWPINEIEQYLKNRIAQHQAAELIEDPDTLPLCTPEERWSSQETWAVTKSSRKRAIKLFSNQTEAKIWIDKNQKPEEKLVIEHRPGEDRRCIGNYCEVAEFCSHGKALRAAMKDGPS